MTDITKKIVKGSKRLAIKSQKLLNKGLSTSEKILSDATQGKYNEIVKSNYNNIKNTMDNVLNRYTQDKQLNIMIKILIALYAAFVIPHLSRNVSVFMDNIIIKILMALLIVYIASKDTSLAILLALAYILTLQSASRYYHIDKLKKSNEYFNNDSISTIENKEYVNQSGGLDITNTENALGSHSHKQIDTIQDNRFISNNTEEEHTNKKSDETLFGKIVDDIEHKLDLDDNNKSQDDLQNKEESEVSQKTNQFLPEGLPLPNEHPENEEEHSGCNLDGSPSPFCNNNYGLWDHQEHQEHQEHPLSISKEPSHQNYSFTIPENSSKNQEEQNTVPLAYDMNNYAMV